MGELDDISVSLERKDFINASIFAVEVGTTGFKGGDAGHGSRAVLVFENHGSTAWEAEVDGPHGGSHPDRVTLRFGGDSEIANLAEALEFASARLREALSTGRDSGEGA